jgi:hypothetical protein
MKNLTICLIATIALLSCNKSNTPPPPTQPSTGDSLLKSFTIYQPLIHVRTLVVLGYDQKKLLASVYVHNFDSSGSNIVVDSTLLSFTQPDSTTPPSSYDLTFHNTGSAPAGTTEHHLIAYDNINRVTGDSVSISQTNNYTTNHYTYDGLGNITIQSFSFDPQAPGSLTYQEIDTMSVPQDNLQSDIAYFTPGGQLVHLISRTFTTNINPFYNPHLANNLGTIFSYNSLVDFKSKNLPDQFQYQDSNFNMTLLTFVWTKDSTGRIVQGIGSDPNSGIAGQIYTYTY